MFGLLIIGFYEVLGSSGSGFRVHDLGYRVWGLGLSV